MRLLLVLFATALSVSGCGPTVTSADYVQTCRSAKTAIPAARQMEELYGDADHFITEYGFGDGPKEWNTEVFFGGRYSLTLQVKVEIDYRHNTLKQVGVPKFYLSGANSVYYDTTGAAVGTRHSGDERWLTEDEWKAVYESGGDYSEIGIVLNPEPLPGFEEIVQRTRSPRIPVSLIDPVP